MNRSSKVNGVSDARTGTSAKPGSAAGGKPEPDKVVVSFESDDEEDDSDASDKESTGDEEEEGRSSSASSRARESEDQPSSDEAEEAEDRPAAVNGATQPGDKDGDREQVENDEDDGGGSDDAEDEADDSEAAASGDGSSGEEEPDDVADDDEDEEKEADVDAVVYKVTLQASEDDNDVVDELPPKKSSGKEETSTSEVGASLKPETNPTTTVDQLQPEAKSPAPVETKPTEKAAVAHEEERPTKKNKTKRTTTEEEAEVTEEVGRSSAEPAIDEQQKTDAVVVRELQTGVEKDEETTTATEGETKKKKKSKKQTAEVAVDTLSDEVDAVKVDRGVTASQLVDADLGDRKKPEGSAKPDLLPKELAVGEKPAAEPIEDGTAKLTSKTQTAEGTGLADEKVQGEDAADSASVVTEREHAVVGAASVAMQEKMLAATEINDETKVDAETVASGIEDPNDQTTEAAAPTVVVVDTPDAEDQKAKKKKKKKKSAGEETGSDDVGADAKLRVNEESDFTVRRSSIDDFIRKILAEARQEQKKRTEDVQTITMPAASTAASLLPPPESVVTARQPDVVSVVNGAVSTEEVVAKLSPVAGVSEDSADCGKLPSLLDRRLASTEQKREEAEKLEQLDSSKTVPGLANGDVAKKPSDAAKKNGRDAGEDIDLELADISRYFAKRMPLPAVENGLDAAVDGARYSADDEPETGWINVRKTKSTVADDDVNESSTMTNGLSQYLATGRRFSSQFAAEAGEFLPQRRPETDEVVRGRMVPVRALIEQQADVVQQLKAVGREIAALDGEIRELRQRCTVERKLVVDSIVSAVAEEMKLYEAEQRAADDRIASQAVIAHFVREQFVASAMGPAVGQRLAGERRQLGGIDPFMFSSDFARKQFSGAAESGSLFDRLPPLPGRRAQSVAPSGIAGEYGEPEIRRQRGGSVTRDAGGFGGDLDDALTAARKRSSMATASSSWYSSAVDAEPTTATTTTRGRLLRGGSVGPSLYSSYSTYESPSIDFDARQSSTTLPYFDASSTSGYDDDSTSYSSGRRYRVSVSSADSDYAFGSGSDYRRSYTSSSLAGTEDPSTRSYRRYSLADSSSSSTSSRPSYDRYSSRSSYGDTSSTSGTSYGLRSSGYVTGSSSTGTGEFRSKFLDKVRERKALAAIGADTSPLSQSSVGAFSSSSSSSTMSSSGDKAYKSRFLRSTFDSEPTTSSRYASTSSSWD